VDASRFSGFNARGKPLERLLRLAFCAQPGSGLR
jgi:hypothetical protein